MPDTMTKEQRSALMSRIRAKGTKPELAMAAILRGMHLRPKLHVRGLPGSPDFAFPRLQLAIFVDGDFWHGWRYPQWRHKLKPFWQAKIERNRERDRSNFRKLRYRGWIVIRVWEHQLRDPERVRLRIEGALAEARSRRG
jgi:DNA mismatch endonuclease (patch repair protein)